MTQQNAIQLFEGSQVRMAWNEEEEKYYFSIVDVVQILTEQPTPRKASTYWAVLKKRLKEEGADELLTNCKQLKLPAADGKNRATDVADLEQTLRIIQSIPSKKAEPILTNILTKAWSGMTTGEYKRYKSLTKENLRDNMTNLELALNTLAEAATTEISRNRNPKTMKENKQVAQSGGKAAKVAREEVEKQIGHSVISRERASDYLLPAEDAEVKKIE